VRTAASPPSTTRRCKALSRSRAVPDFGVARISTINDPADFAASALGEIGHVTRGAGKEIFVAGLHGAHDDAVLALCEAELQRCKEMRVRQCG
jgi:hypothetical protein